MAQRARELEPCGRLSNAVGKGSGRARAPALATCRLCRAVSHPVGSTRARSSQGPAPGAGEGKDDEHRALPGSASPRGTTRGPPNPNPSGAKPKQTRHGHLPALLDFALQRAAQTQPAPPGPSAQPSKKLFPSSPGISGLFGTLCKTRSPRPSPERAVAGAGGCRLRRGRFGWHNKGATVLGSPGTEAAPARGCGRAAAGSGR